MNGTVEQLEREMLKYPQVPCSVRHLFAPGLYIRELSMAAGTLALGHAQRSVQVNILLKGKVRVPGIDGNYVELTAPLTFIGPAGRKAGLVLEDVVWLNVYANPTNTQDIEQLEAEHLDKSDVWREAQALLAPPVIENHEYQDLLAELGVSEELVRAQSERAEDQVDFPPGAYKVKVGPSKIEGQGLIATADIAEGESVCPALIAGKRTPAGRYTNHSNNPNVRPVQQATGVVYWVATRAIAGSRGGEDGEEITIDYREAVALSRGALQ